MAHKKSNIREERLEDHRYSNCLTSKDYGTIAFLIDKKDILKDKKANAESFKETELTHNCIYFLIGYEDEGENSVEKMYVGQAGIRENGQSVLDRLNEHIYTDRDPIKYRNKWSDIVVVTNRDRDAWGATELNALEHIFWSLIPVGSRYNSATPTSTGADLELYTNAVNQIKEYLDYLGYAMFKDKTSKELVQDVKTIAEAKSNMPVDLDLGKTKVPNITTPHKIVEAMVNMLPDSVWNDETVFLDPACKGGEFLREIYDRLMKTESMISKYPNETERAVHIIVKQLHGIALSQPSYEKTKTTLIGCDSNIRLIKNIKSEISGLNEKELQAYINKEFNKEMKIDVVIGNPPYQEMTYSGLNESGGTPIFDSFINFGLDITNSMVCMITPTKWIAGESSNFSKLRSRITEGNHIVKMVDYFNPLHAFEQNQIAGGVSYFLYDKNYSGDAEFISKSFVNGLSDAVSKRKLDTTKGIILRHAVGDSIVDKIHAVDGDYVALSQYTQRNIWGLSTTFKDGHELKQHESDIKVITSHGEIYVDRDSVANKFIDTYKVMLSRVVNGSTFLVDGQKQLLSTIRVLEPGEICTGSYMEIANINKKEYAENIVGYLKTKFVRFLLLEALNGIGLTPERFQFVPMQDFAQSWTDEKLYAKYNLTPDEINYIESIIKNMDSDSLTKESKTLLKAEATQSTEKKLTRQDAEAAYINNMLKQQ